ncbi:MAG: penicillin-binding protein 2 [Nitrospirae bacterium]|nr:penicillin-binding protein 2 [Nitrospirota bacterium]
MAHGRLVIIKTLVLLGFLSVTLRLFDLMILEHKQLAVRAQKQHRAAEPIDARRGAIFDRHYRELAVNRRVESLYGVPQKVTDARAVAASLSPFVGSEKTDLVVKRLSADRSKGFVWLARKLDDNTAESIKRLKLGEQIGLAPESYRSYPKEALAAHLLGSVNIDNDGVEGVELKYDEYLRGKGGSKVHARDARGRALSNGGDYEQPGNSLVLTIDEDLQYIVEKQLADAVEKWNPRAATAIVMDPFTGEILAMGVNPTFSPEKPDRSENRRNFAISDVYEPGSVFKVVVASAALDLGVYTPYDRFDCSRGSIEVGGRVIRDVHRNGMLTLAEVIKKSSNVGSIKIAMGVGKDRYFEYVKKFGFGQSTGIDLPGEARGLFSANASYASVSIGYGIAVTPLQLLTAYSAIANGGTLMKPYLVQEIVGPDGETVKSFQPAQVRRVISENTSRTMAEILSSVTQEGGTAKKAAVDGNGVAGKTGTARKLDMTTKRYSESKYMSSFVGFVPANDPKLAIIVVIDEPRGAIYGGEVAAPVFKGISEHALVYLKVPREDTKNVLLVSN